MLNTTSKKCLAAQVLYCCVNESWRLVIVIALVMRPRHTWFNILRQRSSQDIE